MPDDRGFVTLLSLFQYVFIPLAEAILGRSFTLKSDIGRWINFIYNLYEGVRDAMAPILTAFGALDDYTEADVNVLLKLVFPAVQEIVLKFFESDILKDVVTEDIQEELIQALGSLVNLLKFFFVAANFGTVVGTWIKYRPTFHHLITSSGTGGVTVQ